MGVATESDLPGSAPPQRTPTRRFEARRQAILASAVSELNQKGVRGMTLGEVAARLDLVPTGVIYYFRNKDELAKACFLRAIARFEALIADAMTAAEPVARIDRFLRGFIDFKRQAAQGEAEEIAVFNDVRALNAAAVNEAYVAMFRNARRLLDEPGAALSPVERNARTHLVLSEVYWAVAWLKAYEPQDYGRPADRMAAIMVDGLMAPGARWPTPPRLDLTAAGHRQGAASEPFLRAATELINAEGYHGASVERISARLNVSKGAFYHHNQTKDELVMACFQRTFDIMWRAIRQAEAQGEPGLTVLASVACALVEHQLSGGAPLLRTTALTTAPQALQPELIAKFDRISLRFASILSDGVADGSIRPLDVNVGAQLITGMINAAAELEYWAPGLTTETAADQYVRPLFAGLGAPTA